MELFRNPEVRRSLVIYALLNAAFVCAGFAGNTYAGFFAVAVCAAFDLAGWLITRSRYKRIADLSRDLDAVLHGRERIDFDAYKEGELAILQNEISKMTVMLREQADALLREKSFLSDSIANISHQLRTPLTSINLTISFLSKPALDESKRLHLTRELEKSVGRIDWLITSLLKLSKIDSGTAHFVRQPVLLTEAVQLAAEPLAIPMELREQRLSVESSGSETFTGDQAWTVEAIGNILKNCMEHTPPGGEIRVACLENAIYSEVTVSDTGPGLDSEDLPHLFERFYKGKNAGEQSFGIGLALARTIISEQNGTVKAENAAGGGAKFTIRFYKGAV